jgi:methionyl-tRNA formyltransferase
MRLAYAGTAAFGVAVLEGLLASEHEVVVTVTTPDKPRGRRGAPQPSECKQAALGHGVPVLQPDDLSAPASLTELLSHAPDVLVACAYGRIVGQPVLDALLSVVVHPSLVPRWRGAAPVERALMAGETELGVATLRMTAGVDEGPVGDLRTVGVSPDADAGAAYQALAGPAIDGLLATLRAVGDGSVVWRPQIGAATYATKITQADRELDWRRPAGALAAQVRALSPHIGAVTELEGRRTLVWAAQALDRPPDDARRDRLLMSTGGGWLEIMTLQPESRRRMTAAEYLHGAGRSLAQP